MCDTNMITIGGKKLSPPKPTPIMDEIMIGCLVKDCEQLIEMLTDTAEYFRQFLNWTPGRKMIVTTSDKEYRGVGNELLNGVLLECKDGLHRFYQHEIKDIKYVNEEMVRAHMAGVTVETGDD